MKKIQGLSFCPTLVHETTSVISSSVPGPPGKAIHTSPFSKMVSFLSDILSTIINSSNLSCANSLSCKKVGITPIVFPLLCITVFANIPINPALPPPKTKE